LPSLQHQSNAEELLKKSCIWLRSISERRGLEKRLISFLPLQVPFFFGVPDFAKTLNKIIHDRDIIFKPFYESVKIDGKKQEITF
ncbi:MAG: putative NACHT family NTPase, partial [Algoriphagus sp.]